MLIGLRTNIACISILVWAILSCAQPTISSMKGNNKILEEKIYKALSIHPQGKFAIAFKDLYTGETFFLNERETFHAASTMKTPVLIETFKQAASGKFSIDDSILVSNEFKSIVDSSIYFLDPGQDSEQDLYTRIGSKLPIRDLLHRMITRSSNLATNIIIDLVGASNVNNTMRELGAKDIQVLRGVEDGKAYEKGLNNSSTAYDLLLIMESLATGSAVNTEASKDMISILLDQQHRDKIAAKLPPGVKVASKSGSITAVSHDSGIIFLPEGKLYVLVLLSSGVQDEKRVNETLADISRIFYDYITS